MKQVLSAVSYCHAENIVHRDLKPENLLLDSEGAGGIIKVIDFGTSQKYDPDKKMHQTYGTPYYIAPEILAGEYNEKCDVWSCGVIMYILLCGRPPFDGQTDDEILENVSKGSYKTDSAVWKNVSKDGLDLVQRMLKFDPEKRIQSIDALGHSWIKDLTEGINVDENLATGALKNLQGFRAERKLQQAVCTFMVSQMATKEEMEELQKAFSSLDKNGDGKLSKDELLLGFTDIMGATAAEEEVDRIMNLVDTDQNGWIDYSEFVMATLDKKNLLSDERLETAFRIFDKDNNGFIDASEIRAVLGKGKKLDDAVWDELISEVDINGDGEVSFKEFKKMMQQLIVGDDEKD
jgi:calcium-dependent protein kinase